MNWFPNVPSSYKMVSIYLFDVCCVSVQSTYLQSIIIIISVNILSYCLSHFLCLPSLLLFTLLSSTLLSSPIISFVTSSWLPLLLLPFPPFFYLLAIFFSISYLSSFPAGHPLKYHFFSISSLFLLLFIYRLLIDTIRTPTVSFSSYPPGLVV